MTHVRRKNVVVVPYILYCKYYCINKAMTDLYQERYRCSWENAASTVVLLLLLWRRKIIQYIAETTVVLIVDV